MTRRSKPDSFQPPYPAFQQHQKPDRPDIVMAMIGVQSPSKDGGAELFEYLHAMLTRREAGQAEHVEAAWHQDVMRHYNHILMPYWKTRQDMAAFCTRPDVVALLKTPLEGEIGLWAEQIAAPTTALDANNARPDVRYGIARNSEPKEEQYHAYMGSMRDRVPDFLSGKSNGHAQALKRRPDAASRGAVLEITDLPHNLCFIRGAFSWNQAEAAEQRVFLEKMWPVYEEGADYLRDNGEESGCISMRMAQDIQLADDTGIQSEVLGWFTCLEELERWTRHHPRHLAIMKNIYAYMEQFHFKPKLHMGHEVMVIPQDGADMIYNNCHHETGFLPFFSSARIR